MKELLSRNQSAILGRITQACERAGRSPSEVELVAVTKSVTAEVAQALYEVTPSAQGASALGENRFGGLSAKRAHFDALGVRPHWHFIGHMQRNKARRIARLADVLHALDSIELIDTLGRITAEENWRRDVYLQVKLTREDAKYGLEPNSVPEALGRAGEHAGLRVLGLMTMAPMPSEHDDRPTREAAARAVFRQLRELSQSLDSTRFHAGTARLSMGMSGDFEVAIEEGAHSVRVGRALFEGLERSAPAGGTA